jgi:hypothetical protein
MAGPFDRVRAALESARLSRASRHVRKAEQLALRELGASITNAPRAGPLADVPRRRKSLEAARAEVAASLERDRADYALVRPGLRLVVVLRGVAHRIVLREHVRAARIECDAASERLGEAALDLGIDAPAAERIRSLRAEAKSLEARRTALLARYGGSPTPRFAARIGRELFHFGRTLVNQLIPRLPAIAGMVAGWWVVSTFTDSRLGATLHSWGIGDGPAHYLDADTYESVRFWLPASAAAICAYGGARIRALVRSRYGAEPAPSQRPARIDRNPPRANPAA